LSNPRVVSAPLDLAAPQDPAIGLPFLAQQQIVADIAILDLQSAAAKRELGEAVETHFDVLDRVVQALVMEDQRVLRALDPRPEIDRHPAVSQTAPERFDPVFGPCLSINGEPVFVSP